jgi:hypothetical protein
MSEYLEILKEYITFDRVIMVATLIVAICTLRYTHNRDKRHVKSLIRRKKAQLEAMKMASKVGINVSEMGGVMGNIAALEADIRQLEEEL